VQGAQLINKHTLFLYSKFRALFFSFSENRVNRKAGRGGIYTGGERDGVWRLKEVGRNSEEGI
jgi:hypothetical protein